MSNNKFKTVSVNLPHHPYKIIIGDEVLGESGELIKKLFPDSRVAIITDENVNKLHGNALRKNLKKAGISYETIVVKAGERSKSWAVLKNVVEQLLSYSFERDDVVIGFGGGVVGDLAGFVAGIALRGTNFIQMPTSLLAQVDSAVGGKVGINGEKGKNLVGLFNHPSLVLSDIALLSTLPKRQMRSGYAEIVKYFLINDKEFFVKFEKSWNYIFTNNEVLTEGINLSCLIKSDVVEQDEREKKDRRALLNLGHTFGHALESAANYNSSKLTHGEAIAVGLVLAHRFSTKLKLCSQKDTDRVKKHLENVGLPTSLADIKKKKIDLDINNLMTAIKHDKKVKKGKLTFVLSKGIGKAFVKNNVPETKVREFLKECLKER